MIIPDFKELSPRQIQVMDAMLDTFSCTKAAALLKISPKTVSTYIDRVKEKSYYSDVGVTTLQLCIQYDRWRYERRSTSV
jgi:DNA-binding NarL/FixJ family response regulator